MTQTAKAIILSITLQVLCAATILYGAETAPTALIDVKRTIKEHIPDNPVGANLCWLLDSDRGRHQPRSFSKAIEELGCGSLRFPYGHLADNYLWHTPPFQETAKGLRPKVATLTQAPGRWEWAVNDEGFFRSAMDFDEYMNLCKRLKIKPLVVVNVLSFKYEHGPSYEELKQTAVEWVKYAKRKNYEVAYWQIGNEVDHHQDLLSCDEYVECYVNFVTAMKKVDSSIRTGPGILQSTRYFNEIVSRTPQLIDFVSCHQYMWRYQKTCNTYSLWRECNDRFVPNVDKMQLAVSKSSKPKTEILVTETGVTPSNDALGKINNTYKALWWFEVLMNEIAAKNVSYLYYWGTHSPWSGPEDKDNDDVGVLLSMANKSKPTGEITRIVNNYLLNRIVASTRTSGYIRTYATSDASGSKLNIFLLNKNDSSEDMEIELENDSMQSRSFNRVVFKGKSPDDRGPTYGNPSSVSESNDTIRLRLPPLSLTVLEQID